MKTQEGFTLIEMSIVLVIIGLVVGGVLVGRDLVKAAEVRSQISQIEKYNVAANTFRTKYGFLPGDIKDPEATRFGLTPRGTDPFVGNNGNGEGDGNSIISSPAGGFSDSYGETAMFWEDLTSANGLKLNLITGNFKTASPSVAPPSDILEPNIGLYLPVAAIGGGNYIYVSSNNGVNSFGLAVVTDIQTADDLNVAYGITVSTAYSIDKKMDDGLPQYGNVTAWSGHQFGWAGDQDLSGGPVVAGDGVSSVPSPTTCYDNAGSAGATEKYSLSQKSGAGINCLLSFRFQ
jgi:prepilin-type N-terminal cleavage/methylation domain-containing protein